MIATFVVSLLATALWAMFAFPQTPAAKTLHRVLVEAPARFMYEMTWRKVGQLALSAAALCLMMAMGPQMLALMAAMGLDAAFVEVLIVMYLASVSGGIASTWRSLRGAAARALRFASRPLSRHGRRRQRQRRRSRGSRPQGGKDDKAGPGWAFA